MLTAVLVDDEPLALDELAYILDKHREVKIIGKYTAPLEALTNIKKLRPELVFLDIRMPEMDGLTTAREIINLDLGTHIIFTTVFDQYAIKAFEMDAADYVVKPFSEKRLNLTIDRMIKRQQLALPAACPAQAFIKANTAQQTINKVPVWKENSILLLDLAAILYVTMAEKKVMVHTREDRYESSSSLAELAERLENKGFFRCHRSFIVNTDFIDKILPWYHSTYMIRLKERPEQIPVSRSYTQKLRELLYL